MMFLELLKIVGYEVLALYSLWLFYLAIMNLKRAKDNETITKVALFLAYPLLFIGLLIDFFVNAVVMTCLLLELPQWGEFTVTARVTRWSKVGGWRGDVARFFCEKLLNQFDPSGMHCK